MGIYIFDEFSIFPSNPYIYIYIALHIYIYVYTHTHILIHMMNSEPLLKNMQGPCITLGHPGSWTPH